MSYFFLWAPIVVLVVLSFNKSKTVSVWGGFTTDWYAEIFNGTSQFTGDMVGALRNTLFIAVISTVISTVIGTMVSIALERGFFPGKKIVDAVLSVRSRDTPEITQAVSLAVFFKFLFDVVQFITGQRATLGFGTIIIGHVVFSVSFVVITIRGRLADMNPRYEEAARDLGANEWQTFWRVTFPLILPGIISGALLAFTLSLDDYIVTFFTNGVGTNTLPNFVYGLLRKSVSPEINAISTVLLLASMVLVGFSLFIQGRGANRT